MRRYLTSALLVFALSACGGGFTGQSPIFSANEGEEIFPGDGTLLAPAGGALFARERVRRDGSAYRIGEALAGPSSDGGTASFDIPLVRFIPIRSTPEDDYVAQIQIHGASESEEGEAIYYAFVLRVNPTTFAAWVYPEAIKAEEGAVGPEDNLCRPNGRDHGECEFASRSDLISYYTTYVHDRLVREAGTLTASDLFRFVPLESGREPG
jgi:hypothetical protein